MSYYDQPDEHPEWIDGETGPVWEPAMGNVRGPLHRPAMTINRMGDPKAEPIPPRQEEFVQAALPYLKTEDATMILAHPSHATSQIAAAQRNGDVPEHMPRISLLQAVLATRAEFDRRIRQHAIPPREGRLGRERFEDTAALAAEVPGLAADFDALVDVLQEILGALGARQNLRQAIATRRERGPKGRGGRPTT
jgi:hypothetical protein